MKEMNNIEKANATTDVYLKHLVPVIRAQKGHEYFDWDGTIEYLIERLEGMRDK